MRRLRSFIAVVVALAMLVALAWIGDGWLRSEIESRVETAATDDVPELGVDTVEADIGGRFVIPQLIAGRLDDVRLTSPEVVVDGLAVSDVTVHATDVPIRGRGAVGHVEATGTVPAATLTSAVQRRVDLPEGVSIETRDGEVVAVGSVLGVQLEAAVQLVAQPRAIDLELSAVRLGGVEVDPAGLPVDLLERVGAGSVSLEELPDGLELTSISSTPDGVDLTFVGDDLRL